MSQSHPKLRSVFRGRIVKSDKTYGKSERLEERKRLYDGLKMIPGILENGLLHIKTDRGGCSCSGCIEGLVEDEMSLEVFE